MDNVLHRIEQMERTLRRQKFAIVALVVVIGGMFTVAFDKNSGVMDTLRVRELKVVRSDDSPAIILSAHSGYGHLLFPTMQDSTKVYANMGASKSGGHMMLNQIDGGAGISMLLVDYNGTILTHNILEDVIWRSPSK